MDTAERRALQDAMVRLADGDRSAFSTVFAILWPLLSGFSRRLLRDPDAAEDVAQQALLKVFEHASRFDPSRDAASWAVAVAANECRAWRRRRGRSEPMTEPSMDLPDPSPSPEARAVERAMLAAATETLGSLRSQDIATLAAAWRNDRPKASAVAFRKRLQRATERLRAAWRSRHGTF